MTRKHAERLMVDLEKYLVPENYTESIYLSVRGVGTKTFKQCAFHDADNYIFLWTADEKFMLDKKLVGDFVLVPYERTPCVATKRGD